MPNPFPIDRTAHHSGTHAETEHYRFPDWKFQHPASQNPLIFFSTPVCINPNTNYLCTPVQSLHVRFWKGKERQYAAVTLE